MKHVEINHSLIDNGLVSKLEDKSASKTEPVRWVYDLTNHGVEYADYWQGFGCSFSEFDHVATGVGDTLQDAIEDAMQQAAEMGAPLDMLDEAEKDALGQFTSAQLAESAVENDEEVEEDEDDMVEYPNWRYSISWKLA